MKSMQFKKLAELHNYLFFNFYFWYKIISSSLFYCMFPLPFSPLTLPLPCNHHTVVHVHESFFLFAQSLHSLNAPSQLSPCSPSIGLSLFCLLVQFVHYIPHMSEITWYLSFPDWLISLSIMFSRSIHTVAKGKTFLSFYG